MRILLEEYAPEIIYIKGVHNTVTEASLWLEYDPKLNSTNKYNHATHVSPRMRRLTKNGLCTQNFGPATAGELGRR